MSHGLVPSKSTVYVSNLPFNLRNNDLHKVFEKHGKIVKVTVLKDKHTRESKGVAFILFLKKEDAHKCVEETNSKQMFGRTLKASVAKDNGRSTEFIRRKNYPDKSKCYECGEVGHLSYKCNKNLLGEREPPPKKVRKRKKKEESTSALSEDTAIFYGSSDEEEYREMHMQVKDEETLSAAIALEQEKKELEEYRYRVATGNYKTDVSPTSTNKKIKPSSYFSDEEESD